MRHELVFYPIEEGDTRDMLSFTLEVFANANIHIKLFRFDKGSVYIYDKCFVRVTSRHGMDDFARLIDASQGIVSKYLEAVVSRIWYFSLYDDPDARKWLHKYYPEYVDRLELLFTSDSSLKGAESGS